MKKTRIAIFALLTMLLLCLTVTGFAGGRDENPYKNHYTREAQMLRKAGTAKLVYLFMNSAEVPLPGVTMIYNTTRGKGLQAVADEKGMVVFDVKSSDLYYIRQVIYNGRTVPVTGSNLINNVEKTDIRKGLVLWNCIVSYGNSAFMSYRGN